MTPYYQDDLVTLYHGDALDHLDLWTGADVLVTDPPYGMAYESGWVRKRKDTAIIGDNDLTARTTALEAWGNRPAIVFGNWRQPPPEHTRQQLVWDKSDNGPGMGALDLPWGSGFEEIYVIGKGFTGRRSTPVIRCAGYTAGDAQRPDHPTPKPPALMEALIAKCPSGTIADPFAGSGATLIAAKALGRHAIGFDIDERYCRLAASRLAQDTLAFG